MCDQDFPFVLFRTDFGSSWQVRNATAVEMKMTLMEESHFDRLNRALPVQRMARTRRLLGSTAAILKVRNQFNLVDNWRKWKWDAADPVRDGIDSLPWYRVETCVETSSYSPGRFRNRWCRRFRYRYNREASYPDSDTANGSAESKHQLVIGCIDLTTNPLWAQQQKPLNGRTL